MDEYFLLEQKVKYDKFMDFYSDAMINMYSDLLNERFKVNEKLSFYHAYKNIIKKTAKLINELGINDPFHASVIFEYLLWNGYFSKDNSLVYNLNNRKCNIAALGADIMLGNSVCLNNSDMLTKVLNEMGINSYTVAGSLKHCEGNLEYTLDIKRNIAFIEPNMLNIIDKIKALIFQKYVGNHAITMFEYDGNYSLIDPTGLAFLNFNGFLNAKYVGSDFDFIIKPYVSLILKYIPKENFKEIIIKTYNQNSNLTVDFVKEISEESLEICRNNSNLLADFHTENLNDIDVVCKTLVP